MFLKIGMKNGASYQTTILRLITGCDARLRDKSRRLFFARFEYIRNSPTPRQSGITDNRAYLDYPESPSSYHSTPLNGNLTTSLDRVERISPRDNTAIVNELI